MTLGVRLRAESETKMGTSSKNPIIESFWVDQEQRVKAIKRAGSPSWYLQLNMDGVQRRVSLKTRSKKEASQQASGVATRLFSGELTPAGKRARVTLTGAAEAYCRRLRELDRNEKTVARYERVLDQLGAYLPKGGATPLAKLSKATLENFERKLRTEGIRGLPREGRRQIKYQLKPLSAKSVRDHMKVVRGLLRDAVTGGALTEDPARGYRLPPGPTRKIVTLSPAELAALFADPEPGMADVWRFFVLTCLRAHELIWLLREDVVSNAAGLPTAIHIRAKACPVSSRVWHPKHRRERVVPLPPEAGEILNRAMTTGRSPWAFTSPVARDPRVGRWSYNPLRRLLHARLKACGLRTRGLHVLRHTGATYLANDGRMPITLLRDFLGHRDLATTQLYLHPTADDVAHSLGRVDYTRLTPTPAPAPGSPAPGSPAREKPAPAAGSGGGPKGQGSAAASGATQCNGVPDADASGAETSQNPVNPEREGEAA